MSNMYLEHFQLKRMPFENINDGDFFYESEIHSEAYSRLAYTIEGKKSCCLLTGGYGTGKTCVAEKLKRDMSRKGYVFSLTVNPRLDELGLLKTIFYNFTGYGAPKEKSDVLISLEKFFKDAYKDGKHSVVVIDEAQDIENEGVFEELRLLLNFQSESRSLLTLLLCGQSELSERIYANRQFSQRIFLSYSLRSFNQEETEKYILYRLEKAGLSSSIFTSGAISIVHERSGGIPRWINNICNMSLLEAYSSSLKKVDEKCVIEAVKSFKE